MATKVQVGINGGVGNVAHVEVNGGASSDVGNGEHAYKIGVQGSVVQYLTVQRLGKGAIVVRSLDNGLTVEVDGVSKKVKPKGVLTIGSSAKRAVVHADN